MAKAAAKEDKTIAILAHFSALLLGFVGPLIFYLVKRDEPGFTRENARHALNFQISLILYFIISFILIFVIIGIFMMIALGIFSFVSIIVATIKASEGKVSKYPLEIEFIK